MERTFTVSAHENGQRLDKWLCARFSKLSRRTIKSMIDAGGVRINGRRVVIAGWELAAGDRVVAREDVRAKRGGRNSAQNETPTGRRLKIYYEDRDVIVVEKPAGILSVPNESGGSGENMLAEVRSYLGRKIKGRAASFVAPVHRLDAETSGVMVFALSNTGKGIEKQFKNHTIRREYVAIVCGRVEKENGIVDVPLKKGDFRGGRKTARAAAGEGRRAVTEFRVKERYDNATLLQVNVRTGRTHQIRAHMADMGFPIVGDKLYTPANLAQPVFLNRHALHAELLAFRHPATGKKFLFHSPLPNDIKNLIDQLRGS